MTSSSPGGTPSLTDVRLPRDPRAIVLLLHGGAVHGTQPVDGRNLSWQRARWLMRDIGPALRRDGIGVAVLRYRVKGWNAAAGSSPAPVQDARWALSELARTPDLPVALVGHSMGARTAVAVADHPSVRGVVALAPWLPPGDSPVPLTGKVLRAGHGSMDRITSAAATSAFVHQATRVADATYTDMGPVGHYLLRRVRAWNAFTIAGVRDVLAAAGPDGECRDGYRQA